MNVQGIASAGVYSSEILGTQKKSAASDAQTSAVQTSTRASQDTYVPEDTSASESAGIYQLVSDGAGGQAISFDAPTQGAAPQAAAGAASQASDSTDSTDDTDDLEDEIDELEDERDELQQQLQATQDEQESAKIQKQIDQLDTQIQLKQSQLYASESESES
jgi:predicted RNase H-like nuclease (RuvC/YqgF family)